MLPTFFQQKTAATGAAFGAAQPCAGFRSPARVSLFAIAPPRTHKIAIDELCQNIAVVNWIDNLNSNEVSHAGKQDRWCIVCGTLTT